jgi:hypothetical protein
MQPATSEIMCPIPEHAGHEIDEISKLVSRAASLLENYQHDDNANKAKSLCYEAFQRLEAFFEPDY